MSKKEEKTASERSLNFMLREVDGVLTSKGYRIVEKIGSGTYGKIFACEGPLNGRGRVALKVIDTTKAKSEVDHLMFQNEVHMSTRVKHKNVIQIHDIFRSKQYIFFAMELANGGDLLTYVMKHKFLGENGAHKYFMEWMTAVEYIHLDCRIAHLDIKSDNILLLNGVSKLSDFGFATSFDPQETNSSIRIARRCGTMAYNPPQILAGEKYYPPMVDIWSSGVTLYTVVFGKFPFRIEEGENEKSELYKLQLQHPEYLREKLNKTNPTHEFCALILQMLHPEEYQRPDVRQILANSWVKKFQKS